MERKFAKSGAALAPEHGNGGRMGLSMPSSRERVDRAAGRDLGGSFDIRRRMSAERPAQHEVVHAQLTQGGDVARDIFQHGQIRRRGEFP